MHSCLLGSLLGAGTASGSTTIYLFTLSSTESFQSPKQGQLAARQEPQLLVERISNCLLTLPCSAAGVPGLNAQTRCSCSWRLSRVLREKAEGAGRRSAVGHRVPCCRPLADAAAGTWGAGGTVGSTL